MNYLNFLHPRKNPQNHMRLMCGAQCDPRGYESNVVSNITDFISAEVEMLHDPSGADSIGGTKPCHA